MTEAESLKKIHTPEGTLKQRSKAWTDVLRKCRTDLSVDIKASEIAGKDSGTHGTNCGEGSGSLPQGSIDRALARISDMRSRALLAQASDVSITTAVEEITEPLRAAVIDVHRSAVVHDHVKVSQRLTADQDGSQSLIVHELVDREIRDVSERLQSVLTEQRRLESHLMRHSAVMAQAAQALEALNGGRRTVSELLTMYTDAAVDLGAACRHVRTAQVEPRHTKCGNCNNSGETPATQDSATRSVLAEMQERQGLKKKQKLGGTTEQ
eukprot:Clim_evm45s240 gene=Clim_evmTU45s240